MARIGFFADDLTGASDVLAQAHRHGLDAVLALAPGGPLPEGDVVGVAGAARSLGGSALDETVRAGLARTRGLPIEVLIYKVCSTFDSSPTIGSIGRGIELLHENLPGHGPVPVLPAQPDFGRYTAFSQHFGSYGAEVHRLDRHPVMARHPSTPMHEADLRRVLAEQLGSGADLPAVHLPAYADGSFGERWRVARSGDAPAFVVDAVTEEHMDRIASALLENRADGPALVVGSGGIMSALARQLSRTGMSVHGATWDEAGPSGARGPVLVVSASASAVTGEQIDDAIAHGWTAIPVPVDVDADDAWIDQVANALAEGRDVVAHTTRGTDDPAFLGGGMVAPSVTGTRIGRAAARMVAAGLTGDLMVCGGDTSSHALTALGVRELRVVEQFVPVGPICRADRDSMIAGCRLVLKGGQVGPPDMFRRFARRAPTPSETRSS